MKENYLVQAWLVLALALLFGAALAGVQAGLGEKIERNKLNETLDQIPNLVPGATGGEAMQVDGKTVYRALNDADERVGWVISASGQGFADQIEVLIGLSRDAEQITGLYVLAQKETPGLGDNITREKWLGQFSGRKTLSPLEVYKGTEKTGEYGIQAVAGATISSQSVADIVNTAIAELGGKLPQAATDRQTGAPGPETTID
jgi:electron transport complex protein RnfG